MLLKSIGIIILLYGFLDFKKAFKLYLTYQIFWFGSAPLFNIAGKDFVVSMVMTSCFFVLYLINRNKIKTAKISCPYRLPLCCIVISLFVTCFTGVAGFGVEVSRAISIIVQDILIIWLIWEIIETEEDFYKVIKYFTVVMFLAGIYGFLEYIFKENFIFNIKDSIIHINNYNTMSDSLAASSRGYRLLSVFEHPIGAGMCFGLYCIWMLSIGLTDKKRFLNNKLTLMAIIISVPCVFLTKMRSAMLFTVIFAFSCINLKKRKFYKFLIIVVVVALLLLPLWIDYLFLFLSIFNESLAESVKGTSLQQRISQFLAVKELMEMSPIGGLGEMFRSYVVNQYTDAALSYESIWFEQMAKHGMAGVIANLILAVYSLFIIPHKFKSKELFFLGLAYWTTYTLTSIPSFRMHMYYLVIFYYIKNSDVYMHDRYVKYEL